MMIVNDNEIIKVQTKYDMPILTINMAVIKPIQPNPSLNMGCWDESATVAVYQLEQSEELLEGVQIRHYRLLAK